MNEQDINETIGLAAGFTSPDGWWIYEGKRTAIPDYCNDLNAMHEAEKAFENDYQREEYAARIINGDMWKSEQFSEGDAETTLFATAAQRAEAFLKTLNLWKS